MTTETQTAVEETNGQVKPDAAGVEGAQTTETAEADLDSLLKEWETDEEPKGSGSGKKAEDETAEKPVSDDLKPVLEYVKGKMAEDEVNTQKQVEKEYQETVKSLKGDLPVSDKFVDGYLRIRAGEDKRILAAYQTRHKNPAGWQKVEKALQAEIRKEFSSLPDKTATEARKQITSAIQNAQSTNVAVVEKDSKDMDDVEFQRHLQQVING